MYVSVYGAILLTSLALFLIGTVVLSIGDDRNQTKGCGNSEIEDLGIYILLSGVILGVGTSLLKLAILYL
jgi:hypothetical protein